MCEETLKTKKNNRNFNLKIKNRQTGFNSQKNPPNI